MKKDKEKLNIIIKYTVQLSNAAYSNKEQAIKDILDGARAFGFAEGQAQTSDRLSELLEGKE